MPQLQVDKKNAEMAKVAHAAAAAKSAAAAKRVSAAEANTTAAVANTTKEKVFIDNVNALGEDH